METPQWMSDDVTGHKSVRPGIEADRALYSQVKHWEGENFPADPHDPGFQVPPEHGRPGLLPVREHFLEKFQEDMIT
ncbi:MAG: hypothetical protein KW788_04810 [Candidatus Doudnabacteria bacterium]|nr:hypothetical protein [Candidatus Doudnabacteria bacterium]